MSADETTVLTLIGDAESLMATFEEVDAGMSSVEESIAAVAASTAELTNLDEIFAELDAMMAQAAAAASELDSALSTVAGAAGEASGALADVAASGEGVAATGEAAATAASGLTEEAAAAGEASDALATKAEAEQKATTSSEEHAAAATAAKDAVEEEGMISEQAATQLGAISAMLGLVTGGFLKMGVEAQTSMQTLFDLTGASNADIAAYSSGLQDMALKIGVTMDEAAKGMYFVASAGYDASHGGMEVLTNAMKAAKAGGADMMVVSDALTSAMRAYGASASQSGEYTDMLIQAVSLGKQTFQDLASSIGPAAVTGKEAGFAFRDVASAEALMTQSGFDAHRAVMDLDFLMRSIGVNAAHVGDVAHKLGLHFNNTAFSAMDLHDRLEYLQNIAHGNVAEFEKLVGGANGLAAASILASNGGKNFANMLKQMGDSAGVTDTAFEKSEQTLGAHFEKLKAVLSVISLQIVNALTPLMSPILDKIGAALTGLADAITHHLGTAVPILAAFGTIIGGTVITGLLLAAAAFLAPAAPILFIIGAIGLLVGAVIAIVQHWHDITTALNKIGIFHEIGAVFQTIAHYVGLAVDAFKQVFFPIQKVQEVAKPLTDTFDRASGIIHSTTIAVKPLADSFDRVRSAVFGIHGVVQPLLDSFDRATGVFHKTGQAINPFVDLFKGLKNILQEIGGALAATFVPVWHQLVDLWQKQLMPSFKELWAAIVPLMPVFKALGQIVGGIIIFNIGVLIAMITGLVKGFAVALGGIIEFVGGVVHMITGAVQIVSGIVTLLFDLLRGHWGKLGADFKRIGDGILNMTNGFGQALMGLFKGFFGAIGGFLAGFIQGFIGFFQHLFNVLIGHSIIPDMINGIVRFFLSLPGRILSGLASFVGNVIGFFGNMVSGALQHLFGLRDGTDAAMRLAKERAEYHSLAQKDAVIRHTEQQVQGSINALVEQASETEVQMSHAKTAAERNALAAKLVVLRNAIEMKAGYLHHLDETRKGVEDRMHALKDKMAQDSKDAQNNVLTNIGEMKDRALSAVSNFVSQAVSFIASLPGKLGTIFHNLASQAVTWMLDFGHGLLNGITQIPGMIGGALHNVADGFKHLLGFSKPDTGPLADVDHWMPDFGDMLVRGLNAQVSKVGRASLNVATSIAQGAPSSTTLASYNVAAAQPQPQSDQAIKILSQILSELQRGNAASAQALRNNIGPQPLNANYAAINQYNNTSLNGNSQGLLSVYQQLNTMAGRAFENSTRGAPTGLG